MKSGYLPIIIEIVIREINTLESRLDLLKERISDFIKISS